MQSDVMSVCISAYAILFFYTSGLEYEIHRITKTNVTPVYISFEHDDIMKRKFTYILWTSKNGYRARSTT